MDARFAITDPASTKITLRLTATVSEWRKLYGFLADTTAGSPVPQFLGQVRHLIESADAALSTEKWTTGYATGNTGGTAQEDG